MNTARFVMSPYYEIIDKIVPVTKLIGDGYDCADFNGRIIRRQVIEFRVNNKQSQLLRDSKQLVSMINGRHISCIIRFCKAGDMWCDEFDILVKDAFPHHLYVSLNNNVVSLPNLLAQDRGGNDGRRYPRPVELEQGMIMDPGINNVLQIHWAQSNHNDGGFSSNNEQYYCAVYVVRVRSYNELITTLLSHNQSALTTNLNLVYEQCISLNSIVDSDVTLKNSFITTSLCCPVSRGRMKIPIRGRNCNHVQCFDCFTFLVINFKKPTWLCPVCDKKTFFCYLEVDSLLLNVLKDERSSTVENIQFNKSGQWRPERKIPGLVNDDEPFYDITEYVDQSQLIKKISSTPASVIHDNNLDFKVEKSLQQIFNTSQLKFSPQSQNHQLPSNVTDIKIETKPVTDQFVIEKVEHTTPSSSAASVNDNLPQLLSMPITSVDNTVPQLQITNVRSMAKDFRQVLAQTATVDSSTTTDIGSYKQMMASNTILPHQTTVVNYIMSEEVPQQCQCTPNIVCATHNNNGVPYNCNNVSPPFSYGMYPYQPSTVSYNPLDFQSAQYLLPNHPPQMSSTQYDQNNLMHTSAGSLPISPVTMQQFTYQNIPTNPQTTHQHRQSENCARDYNRHQQCVTTSTVDQAPIRPKATNGKHMTLKEHSSVIKSALLAREKEIIDEMWRSNKSQKQMALAVNRSRHFIKNYIRSLQCTEQRIVSAQSKVNPITKSNNATVSNVASYYGDGQSNGLQIPAGYSDSSWVSTNDVYAYTNQHSYYDPTHYYSPASSNDVYQHNMAHGSAGYNGAAMTNTNQQGTFTGNNAYSWTLQIPNNSMVTTPSCSYPVYANMYKS